MGKEKKIARYQCQERRDLFRVIPSRARAVARWRAPTPAEEHGLKFVTAPSTKEEEEGVDRGRKGVEGEDGDKRPSRQVKLSGGGMDVCVCVSVIRGAARALSSIIYRRVLGLIPFFRSNSSPGSLKLELRWLSGLSLTRRTHQSPAAQVRALSDHTPLPATVHIPINDFMAGTQRILTSSRGGERGFDKAIYIPREGETFSFTTRSAGGRQFPRPIVADDIGERCGLSLLKGRQIILPPAQLEEEHCTLARAGDEHLYARTRLGKVNEAAGIAERRVEGARVCEAELGATSSHQTALGRARSAARLSSFLFVEDRGRGGVVDRLLAFHLGEPVSIPGGFGPGCSCRTMPLVSGFPRGSPVSSALAFRCCFALTLLYPYSALNQAFTQMRNLLLGHIHMIVLHLLQHVDHSSQQYKWVQSPAGSPDFRKWESCLTMPLVCGFSRGSPVSPAPSFRRRSIFTSIALTVSQDLVVKSRPNIFTHYLYSARLKKAPLHMSWLEAEEEEEGSFSQARDGMRLLTLGVMCKQILRRMYFLRKYYRNSEFLEASMTTELIAKCVSPPRPENFASSMTCRLNLYKRADANCKLHIGCLLSQWKATIGPAFSKRCQTPCGPMAEGSDIFQPTTRAIHMSRPHEPTIPASYAKRPYQSAIRTEYTSYSTLPYEPTIRTFHLSQQYNPTIPTKHVN
ncbi:hypothetical protein PR048_032242 [Dryococelus australis]|uniref:Uncharacterized protein n=1 Tax=Dryococelus australis TaxID=614101 RepID=A0ABQ9G5S6_9NEOP|nr:hypothetical protein PR048_032242 [Dryococelus australis]